MKLLFAFAVLLGAGWLIKHFRPSLSNVLGEVDQALTAIVNQSEPTLGRRNAPIAIELHVWHPKRPELFDTVQERISTALSHLKVKVSVRLNPSERGGWVTLVPNNEATSDDLLHAVKVIDYFLRAHGFDVLEAIEQPSGRRLLGTRLR